MAESWKQAKIYVASGYFDMEGERQQIFNSVLPEIRKACVLLRVQVHFVDLRVGVNEHDWWLLIDKGGFEPILLEIDRCAPFFVGIYGEKYGRMVEDYKFPRDPTWNKIREGFPPGSGSFRHTHHAACVRC